MKRNHDSLGVFFKEKRSNMGMTQLDVARKLGYTSAQFISNFERGLCSLPLPAIRKLTQLYKTDGKRVFELIMAEQESYVQEQLFGRKAGPKRRQ
jgi:transcriptional regulator with XRE-family HTH domain